MSSETVLSTNMVAQKLGIHASTLNRWLKQGTFVPRVQLGPRRVGYLESDVTAWLNARRNAA